MQFEYQAVNAEGQAISGQIDAASEREAARLLRQQDLTPLSLSAAATAAPARPAKPASAQENVLVIREFSTLLLAGVPLAEAVESIATAHAASQVGGAFGIVLRELRGGRSLSAALEHAEMRLPAFVAQLVAAGELTGKLGQALQTAADQMEYQERVRQDMRNALVYPIVLVVSGIVATLLVFVLVVPKFATILRSNPHADIPAISQWVIGAGLFVQQHLLWVGLAAAALLAAAVAALRNAAWRARLFNALSRLPIAGSWVTQLEVGRWAAMLGALLENRVPIISAMELAQGGVRIPQLRARFGQVVREVRGGKKLADALAGARALGATGLNLVRVGERSGELAAMLRALARLYENAGRDRMKRFLSLLEPATILLIGSVIGLIMAAVMLAITSINNIPLQ